MSRRASTIRRGAGALGAAALLLAGSAATAAVPVEESVPSRGGEQPAQGQRGAGSAPAASSGEAVDARSMDQAQGGSGDAGRLSQLFYQIQVLQQEVQQLRGMVEEQSYRLERLARDQQEQYLDLDRRMQALREGAGPARVASPSGQSGGSTAGTGGASPGAGSGGASAGSSSGAGSGGAAGSEREAYANAFDLMRQRQFEASAQAFEALIQNYPNGAYTPNAFYWLGELHLAQDEHEAARQSFAQVVNLYPDHQKVPDALYKLGVAYHRLGDVERARRYLDQVRSDYPQSSAAGLAQTYLAEL